MSSESVQARQPPAVSGGAGQVNPGAVGAAGPREIALSAATALTAPGPALSARMPGTIAA
jgi:hypothetical protein